MWCGEADGWSKGELRSAVDEKGQAVVDLTMYTRGHAPSLSQELDECVAQFVGEVRVLPGACGPSATGTLGSTVTPQGESERTSGTTHQGEGEEEEEGDVFLSPRAVESVDIATRAPTSSNHQHPLAIHRAGITAGAHFTLSLLLSPWTWLTTMNISPGDEALELEDYLCTCLYCPRAVAIQRAYQLYGFALDHPQSEALLRVLRACANYDETVVEIDPLLVLHAEKLLEELQMHENEAFRLLAASHFQRRS